jgi:ABC-type nitrate/sulfonate/bicarbonate transport system ATPase subunit
MHGAGASFPIQLEIARKVYRRKDTEPVEAIRDLHLTIRRRETVCLIGPSGTGKTTALRILIGLDRDFEGSVSPDPGLLRIGTVFQEPRLLPWRSVADNVRLALPRGERRRSLDRLLADLGLADWRSRYPGELSGGMARRVALARALVIDPDLLVLDEPFISLDDRAASELRGVVFDMAARRGLSVLMVTHDIDEALAFADRMILLTPRPASLLAEVPLPEPRATRDPAWIDRLRRDLAALYPTAVSA